MNEPLRDTVRGAVEPHATAASCRVHTMYIYTVAVPWSRYLTSRIRGCPRRLADEMAQIPARVCTRDPKIIPTSKTITVTQ